MEAAATGFGHNLDMCGKEERKLKHGLQLTGLSNREDDGAVNSGAEWKPCVDSGRRYMEFILDHVKSNMMEIHSQRTVWDTEIEDSTHSTQLEQKMCLVCF